jgi:hypothetical protein
MYIYVCVYTCVYMRICVYICMYICIHLYIYTYIIYIGMMDTEVEVYKFRCPYHSCHTCTPAIVGGKRRLAKSTKTSSSLHKCNLCPRGDVYLDFTINTLLK